MSILSSSDLLSDFKFFRGRPSTDEESTDTQLYRMLTLAQREVYDEFAPAFPRLFMVAPVLMTSSDGGLTYTIPTSSDEDGGTIIPLGHAEVYGAQVNGTELYASTYSPSMGGVIFEGDNIRIPGGNSFTFSSGPYIRYSAMPGTISGTSSPTLPHVLRDLIVPKALVIWAQRGSDLDETQWVTRYNTLKQNKMSLLATQWKQANNVPSREWWRQWRAASLVSSGIV